MSEEELPPLSEIDRDLSQKAVNYFEEGKYREAAECFGNIGYRPADFRLRHNWKVAEFHDRLTTDAAEFRKELNYVIKEAPISIESLIPEDIKYPIIVYNLAVMHYHHKQYKKSCEIVVKLSQNLSNIINQFSKRVKLLYIDILLKMQQFDKAMDQIEHFESQLKAHGDASSVSSASSSRASPRQGSSPASNDSKEAADSKFDTSVRVKLHQFKIYCCLSTRSIKSAKREYKQLFSMIGPTSQTNIVGVYLKAYHDYLRGNLKKAVKVISSAPADNNIKVFFEKGDLIDMMFSNNEGCCHFYMGRPNVAAYFFQKAFQEEDKDFVKDKKALPLHSISYNKFYEIMYNFGLSLLHANKPEDAFKALSNCLVAYYTNPRLWLRIAECCVQLHKPTNEEDLAWAPDKRNLIRGVTGVGKTRKLLLANPSAPTKPIKQSSRADGDEPSLKFANICIENALKLMQSDTVANEGCLYVKPSNPITNQQEISCLHAAILCAGAYISLVLENFTVAIKRCGELLAMPNLPGAYQYLGKMYLGEALFKYGDVEKSLETFDEESLCDLRYCVSPTDNDEKKDESAAVESGWANSSTNTLNGQIKPLQEWYPKDDTTAQVALVYNRGVALAASGDLEKAAEVLKVWISKTNGNVLPPEFLMLAVYIHIRLGNVSKARSLLKQHSPNHTS